MLTLFAIRRAERPPQDWSQVFRTLEKDGLDRYAVKCQVVGRLGNRAIVQIYAHCRYEYLAVDRACLTDDGQALIVGCSGQEGRWLRVVLPNATRRGRGEIWVQDYLVTERPAAQHQRPSVAC
ncbi:MAG TPA: hypothetical protein VMQ44_03000 [Candidatus Saccharimonadales bacterium]|nr:hypothetical protein [Candidatus Saccharimonadales bacterium]